jgi:hypothetical protein
MGEIDVPGMLASRDTLLASAAVQEDGTCSCGPTTWQGHRAMSISLSCWARPRTTSI